MPKSTPPKLIIRQSSPLAQIVTEPTEEPERAPPPDFSEILTQLADKWSDNRRNCAKKVTAMVGRTPTTELSALFGEMSTMAASAPSWQATEGALMGINALVKQFKWKEMQTAESPQRQFRPSVLARRRSIQSEATAQKLRTGRESKFERDRVWSFLRAGTVYEDDEVATTGEEGTTDVCALPPTPTLKAPPQFDDLSLRSFGLPHAMTAGDLHSPNRSHEKGSAAPVKYLVFGKESFGFLPRWVSRYGIKKESDTHSPRPETPQLTSPDILEIAFLKLSDPQLGVRALAAKVMGNILGRLPLWATSYWIKVALRRLARADMNPSAFLAQRHWKFEPSSSPPSQLIGAFEAEGILALVTVLLKRLPPDTFLAIWGRVGPVLSSYLGHPASTVRQTASKAFCVSVSCDSSEEAVDANLPVTTRTMEVLSGSLEARLRTDGSLPTDPEERSDKVQTFDVEPCCPSPTFSWEWCEGRMMAFELALQFLLHQHALTRPLAGSRSPSPSAGSRQPRNFPSFFSSESESPLRTSPRGAFPDAWPEVDEPSPSSGTRGGGGGGELVPPTASFKHRKLSVGTMLHAGLGSALSMIELITQIDSEWLNSILELSLFCQTHSRWELNRIAGQVLPLCVEAFLRVDIDRLSSRIQELLAPSPTPAHDTTTEALCSVLHQGCCLLRWTLEKEAELHSQQTLDGSPHSIPISRTTVWWSIPHQRAVNDVLVLRRSARQLLATLPPVLPLIRSLCHRSYSGMVPDEGWLPLYTPRPDDLDCPTIPPNSTGIQESAAGLMMAVGYNNLFGLACLFHGPSSPTQEKAQLGCLDAAACCVLDYLRFCRRSASAKKVSPNGRAESSWTYKYSSHFPPFTAALTRHQREVMVTELLLDYLVLHVDTRYQSNILQSIENCIRGGASSPDGHRIENGQTNADEDLELIVMDLEEDPMEPREGAAEEPERISEEACELVAQRIRKWVETSKGLGRTLLRKAGSLLESLGAQEGDSSLNESSSVVSPSAIAAAAAVASAEAAEAPQDESAWDDWDDSD